MTQDNREILLNPGPVVLSEGVREALTRPDLCHREQDFTRLQKKIRADLLGVYGLDNEQWAPVLISGSGTAAMEAMISSLVPSSGHLLVLENGVYGERLTSIAQIHRISCSRLRLPWGEAFDAGQLDALLENQPEVTHLAVVHHETTTGRLNDIAAIGRICEQRGIRLLVDAVSSFGAEELDFANWGISAVAATANKCLHAVPGACFVMVRRELLTDDTLTRRTLYLDLPSYCRIQDADGTPFTPAIPAFYALDAALDEMAAAGGWQPRGQRYRVLADRVTEGLAELGIMPWLPVEDCSVVLRSYHLPAQMTYEDLHAGLKARGFVIYAGQGLLEQKLFRISTMGEISDADVDRLLAAFSELLG